MGVVDDEARINSRLRTCLHTATHAKTRDAKSSTRKRIIRAPPGRMPRVNVCQVYPGFANSFDAMLDRRQKIPGTHSAGLAGEFH